MRTARLTRFCEILGIDAATVATETTPKIHLSRELTAQVAQKLAPDDVQSLIDAFGDALSLQIRQDGLWIVQVTDGKIANLGRAIALLRWLDAGERLELVLDLDKDKLLGQVDYDRTRYHVVLYFFKDNLVRDLDVPLPALDQSLSKHRHKHVAIVALTGDFHCSGRFLTIASLKDLTDLPRLLATLPPASESRQRRADRYLYVASHHLIHVGFELKYLTPLHFLGYQDGQAPEKLCSILRRHIFHLCILYTANRSAYDEDDFQVDYASSDQTITLELSDAIPNDASVLADFAQWPYTGERTDRLTIFQTVAARELPSSSPRQNYHSFVGQIEHILGEARWHHRFFVNERIDKHFEQVQNLVSYVSDAAGELSAAVDTLTKGLTDTLLATIGVVLLSFLAGLIENEVQDFLFQVSMRVYTGYVLFQALYRMIVALSSYRTLAADVNERLEPYTLWLGRGKIHDLLSPLERHQTQFQVWFVATAISYVLLAAALWRLGGWIAPYLIQRGVLPPPPTPAATPTP